MDLRDVMQELADRCESALGIRAYGHPVKQPQPPCAVVAYPSKITFDDGGQRGADVMNIGVVVIVGDVEESSTRDDLAAYCKGSGAQSVKAALQGRGYTAMRYVTVEDIDFDTYTPEGETAPIAAIGGAQYMCAIFNVTVRGKG